MNHSTEPDVASAEFKASPFRYWEMLRRLAPAHPVKLRSGGSAWLITRYEDAVAVLSSSQFAKDPLNARGEAGSKPPWLPGPLRALSQNMLDVDEPDHRRLRNLVQKAFTAKVVEELRSRIESIADTLLDRMQHGRDSRVDLISGYASPIPVTVIAELLGVDDRDRRRFARWSNRIVAADTSVWHKLLAIPSGVEFILFLRRLVRERARDLGGDLLSQLIQAHEGGDRLSSDELLAMCFLLLVAGHETTVNLIGNGVLALVEHPDQMELLRREPHLLPSAVEEILRYSSPLQMATERYATADVTVGGMTIPRGSLVYVVLAAANRDEATFSDAARFDITRQPNRHLAFGHGIHYCLGAPLARVEGEIAIGMLLKRFRTIDLDQSVASLRWRRGLVLRGLESLPVRLAV